MHLFGSPFYTCAWEFENEVRRVANKREIEECYNARTKEAAYYEQKKKSIP